MPGLLKNNAIKKGGGGRLSLFGGTLVFHPLFLIVGAVQCFTGTFLSFLTVVCCALLHELAHAYASARIGYRLNRIVLMPYGATLDGEFSDLSAKDEITIALAGPLCNLACAALFLGAWWCFPTAYAYTDTAFFASLSLGLCNLLPAYPLDGGRILKSALYHAFIAYMPPSKAQKRANMLCKIITILIAALLLTCFLFGAIAHTLNWTILSFCIFLLLGAFEKKDSHYIRMDFSLRSALSRGVFIKHVAVFETCTVKRALTFLSQGEYLALDIYSQTEAYLGTVTQNELSAFFLKHGLYAQIGTIFGKLKQKKENSLPSSAKNP